jgi:hypothetical protein
MREAAVSPTKCCNAALLIILSLQPKQLQPNCLKSQLFLEQTLYASVSVVDSSALAREGRSAVQSNEHKQK